MKKIVIIIFALYVTNVMYSQSYKIIVNNENSTSSLSINEVSAMLLKKKMKWSDGVKVYPVDLSSKSTVRKTLSKEVHRKSVSQVRAYWQQSVFSGKATPPREMISDDKIIAFVKSNKGAIGYVSLNANTSGVKVVSLK